jgi:hypothetical protein
MQSVRYALLKLFQRWKRAVNVYFRTTILLQFFPPNFSYSNENYNEKLRCKRTIRITFSTTQ